MLSSPNDDGIDSEGLWQLAALARECSLTPVIAAPLAESSGSSAGLNPVGSDTRVVTVASATLATGPRTPGSGHENPGVRDEISF